MDRELRSDANGCHNLSEILLWDRYNFLRKITDLFLPSSFTKNALWVRDFSTWRLVAIMSTDGRMINNCKRHTGLRMLGTIGTNTKGMTCSKAFNFVLP